MRCNKYAKLNGVSWPTYPKGQPLADILIRVDATPTTGKYITASHGEFIDGQWVEIIDEQLTPDEIINRKHSQKALPLKRAENTYLNLIASIPGATSTDSMTDIMQKLEATSTITTVKKVSLGLQLLSAIREIEVNGGQCNQLPNVPHDLTPFDNALPRVSAVPDPGNIIVKSHYEQINNQWVEIIDEQMTPDELKEQEYLNKSVFTKLAIRRAMRDLGMEETLDELLASNDTFSKEWADSQDFNLSEPIAQQALQELNLTEEQFKLIKIKTGEHETRIRERT